MKSKVLLTLLFCITSILHIITMLTPSYYSVVPCHITTSAHLFQKEKKKTKG